MRYEIVKVGRSKDTYLGFINNDNVYNIGDVIYFMFHDYKIFDIRDNCLFVRLIS